MTPAGLPGFLRRSIRTVDDDNIDVDSDEMGMNSSSPAVGSPARSSLIPHNRPSDREGLFENTSKFTIDNNEMIDNNHSDSQKHTNGNGHAEMKITGDNTIETPPNSVDLKFRVTTVHTDSSFTSISSENNESKPIADLPPTQAQTRSVEQGHSVLLNKTNAKEGMLGKQRSNKSISSSPRRSVVEESQGKEGNESNNKTDKDGNDSQQEQKQNGEKKETRTKNYKEKEFDRVISSPVVDITDLRKLTWNGIPPHHRPQAWKILLGYLPTNTSRRNQTLKRKRSEYRDAIAQHYDIDDHSRTMQEQETLRQVLVDVPRTAPDVPLFRNDLIRQSLARLLYIWAMRHPASSYVQGINDLATPLLAVFLSEYFDGNVLEAEQLDVDLTQDILDNVEADVYWCLTNLLAGIQDHYTQDQPGVQRMVMRLEELVTRMDVGLTQHLETTGVQFMQFAFRWMNCLLLREFDLKCIIRLWDTYLSEGEGGFETFHVYVCAAFLCQFSGTLRGMQFDELFGFMQNIPTSNWGDGELEIVLSQAFVLSTLFQDSKAHLTSVSPRLY